MSPEEQQRLNNELHKELEGRIKKLEDRMAEKDLQYAVINTKLTAILWGIGVIGTAIVGVLVKIIFA
ncbi:MAG: hypothetical protein IJY72_07820 [Akkermansia sp.]|jgi:hypothetical protein|nr:hypothetical protein [Akkermansia sp.]